MYTIVKRSGKEAAYNINKIRNAVYEACVDSDMYQDDAKDLSWEVARAVDRRIKEEYNHLTVHVEDIQNMVEQELMQRDYHIAKSYIIYRYQHQKLRDNRKVHEQAMHMVDEYLAQNDWKINENSNMSYSLQGLNNHISGEIIKQYWLQEVYNKRTEQAHKSGDFHIHDLSFLSGYCAGWDMEDLLIHGFGGVPYKTESKPPKHLDTALLQIVNFLYSVQGETAGAVALSSFDTYLAPFIRYDGLSYKEVKQAMQKFIFNINVPTRTGFQCLSEDTEILTPDGWMKHDELGLGDTIKTFNIESHEIEDQEVKGMFRRMYEGDMYRLSSRTHDQLISPEHRVVVKNSENEYVLQKIEDINIYKDNIRVPSLSSSHKVVGSESIDNIAKRTDYSGVIWCPNTDNGTVIARRNGKVFVTGNSPFTNITLDLQPLSTLTNEPVIVDGRRQDTTYSEFQEEMNMLNRAFAEVMVGGDSKGKIFPFPIPTINITDDFDWDDPELEPIWEMTAQYGIPYFCNMVGSDIDPSDIRSMCCRLRLDAQELRRRGGGLFGANPLTGSLNVTTLNMPRIGYLAETEEEYMDRVYELMDIAFKAMETKRKAVEKFTDAGLYPYVRHYLRDVKKRFGEYWKNHFNTVGVIGFNESMLNFMGRPIMDEQAHQFVVRVMEGMRDYMRNYQERTGNLANLEATPGEGCSYRLAKIDKEKYGNDIIVANEDRVRSEGAEPYYTNSSQLPVSYTENLFEALDLQNDLQKLYTGGTVFHCFLGERMPDAESTKKLVRRIAENYEIPYYSITPTFSICPSHGYLSGEWEYCPYCDDELRAEGIEPELLE